MPPREVERTGFRIAREVRGGELLHAHWIEQRFSAHVHEEFVSTVIEHGA